MTPKGMDEIFKVPVTRKLILEYAINLATFHPAWGIDDVLLVADELLAFLEAGKVE